MWSNQQPTESQPQSQPQPLQPIPPTSSFQRSGLDSQHQSASHSRPLTCIGASLEIKGRITAEEDLQIDAKVDGPVVVSGHRLIVGRSGQLNSEVAARELVVYGKVRGNVDAADRVEIKRDGEMTGDIHTMRISIEDGAVFKGRIEVGGPGPATKSGKSSDLVSENVV